MCHPFSGPPNPKLVGAFGLSQLGFQNGLGLELACGMVGRFGSRDHPPPPPLWNGWGLELRSLVTLPLPPVSLEQGPSAPELGLQTRVFGEDTIGGGRRSTERAAHNYLSIYLSICIYLFIYSTHFT